jgi:hypothetical protein
MYYKSNSKDDESRVQAEKRLTKKRVKQEVGSFVRKAKFEAALQSGQSPADAARSIGIRLPIGRELKKQEILTILERGSLRKRY